MNIILVAMVWFLVMFVGAGVVNMFDLGPLNGYTVTAMSMVALVVAAAWVFCLELGDRVKSRRRWEERGRQMVIEEAIKHHAALREAQQAALRG